MATCPDFQEFGRDVLQRKTGEIGMHLHAWNSPPLLPLTSDDYQHQPYLIEYPEHVMREKIYYMTALLEETFEIKMTSHRAGRWSFTETYAQILLEKGYLVDSSVLPHVSLRRLLGDPSQSGGTDYSNFPEMPYLVNLQDISKPGDSPLLEVPVTVLCKRNHMVKKLQACFGAGSLPRRVLNRLFSPMISLRPDGRNLKSILQILGQIKEEKRDCVTFMLHSSELMPGGSPTFRRDQDIAALYSDLETLFSTASESFKGATLTEYYYEFCDRYT
jgi:hypothetical protein